MGYLPAKENQIPSPTVDSNQPVSLEYDTTIEASYIDSLIQTMPLEEKVAQLQGAWLKDLVVDGKLSPEKCKELIPFGIGHLAQFSSSIGLAPKELQQLVTDVQLYQQEHTQSKIPAIFHEEAISGFSARGATTLPQQIGMGCSWNPELIQKNAALAARQMRMVGATQALSPMLDICRDARWGRIEESFGEEPYLVARMGHAFITGLQGQHLATGIAGTTKHFAGYAGGVDDPKAFHEETLLPHEVAVKLSRAQNAMAGYHAVKDVPCSASEYLLTDILRKKWQFDGVVISDFWSVNQVFTKFKYAKGQPEAAKKSLEAGLDVELPKGAAFPHLSESVRKGTVDTTFIHRALRRVLQLKARLGILKSPGSSQEIKFDTEEDRKHAYQAAVESIVLLKNDGILPLGKETKKIAVVGPNADAVQSLLGDYTYQSLSAYWWKLPTNPNEPKLVTLLEGLRNKTGSKTAITYARGVDWTRSFQDEIKAVDTTVGDARSKQVTYDQFKDIPIPDKNEALALAKDSDVVVAAMGEHLYLTGEGRDRDNVRLPGDQEAFIKELAAQGKPVILVVFGGRPQILTELEPLCAAIIQAWFPGEEGGNAVADIILGNANPSGKLTTTFPRDSGQIPIWYSQGYTASNPPLYPFGHGVSYTTFEYSDLKTDASYSIHTDWIPVSFTLSNTGNRAGYEVIQTYVSPDNEESPLDSIELKGFKKVFLEPKASKTVTLFLHPQQFSFYENGAFHIRPGTYTVLIGSSSTDIRLQKEIELQGEKKSFPERSVFFSNVEVSP